MSTLSPEEWQVLSPYLDQALAMSEDERAAWLRTLAEQKPAMAAQVVALLDEHRVLEQEGFLKWRPGERVNWRTSLPRWSSTRRR
jgi:hypothetical protein